MYSLKHTAGFILVKEKYIPINLNIFRIKPTNLTPNFVPVVCFISFIKLNQVIN